MVVRVIDVGIIGASGYTGAELLRLCAGHPELRVVFATGDSQAGTALAELYPSLAAAYPRPVFDSYDPAAARPGSTWCSAACPTAPRQALMPVLREKVRLGRRPGRRLPAPGRRAVPDLVRRGPRRPRAAARLRLRPARAVPGRDRRRLRRGHARAATRRPPPWPWPRSCSTAWSRPPGIVVDAVVRRVGRRPAARSPTPPSARSTRTSPPTACSPTGTPRRWSRPWPGCRARPAT